MFCASAFVVTAYIIFVITSNISTATDNIIKTKNETFNKPPETILKTGKINNSSIQNNDINKLDNQHLNESIDDESIMTEGGSMKPPSNSISTLAENKSKKPTSKIVPRKGATSPDNFTTSFTGSLTEKPVLSTAKTSVAENNKPKLTETTIKSEISTVKTTGNITINNGNTTMTNNGNGKKSEIESPVKELNATGKLVVTVVSTTKKPRPKPTATIGESEEDKPIRSSFATGKKIDYIVPVIITIVTVPLLSIVVYIIYRKGRDCWDKRHYRRMDFLIDGMYNE